MSFSSCVGYSIWKPLSSRKQTTVQPVLASAEQKSVSVFQNNNAALIQYMTWANTFITILPLPIVLIDKKGFVHHTNHHFDILITIPYDANRCPYIGRFFDSSTFRSSLEQIKDHEDGAVTIHIRIKWIIDHLKNTSTNELFEWTMSGDPASDAAVIIGRPRTTQGVELLSAIADESLEADTKKQNKYLISRGKSSGETGSTQLVHAQKDDTAAAVASEKANMDKYKRILEERANRAAAKQVDPYQQALIQNTTNRWMNFLDHCDREKSGSDLSKNLREADAVNVDDKQTFVNLIKKAADI